MFGSNRHTTTTTTTTKPTFMTRLRGRNANNRTVKTTTKTAPGTTHRNKRHNYGIRKTHHHQRKATMGDKFSGAMLKIKGSLTHRPGVKAAGTRRMHGTDGRGSHY